MYKILEAKFQQSYNFPACLNINNILYISVFRLVTVQSFRTYDVQVLSFGHLSEVTAPPGTIENLSLAVGVRLALPRGAGGRGSPSILQRSLSSLSFLWTASYITLAVKSLSLRKAMVSSLLRLTYPFRRAL